MMDDDLLWILKWFHLWNNGKLPRKNESDQAPPNEIKKKSLITIGTLDNPGWYLNINLRDTTLEHRTHHPTHDVHRSAHDWIAIMKREGKFEAYGGPFNFPHIQQAFRRWAETGDDNVQIIPVEFEWTHLVRYSSGYRLNMNQIQDNLTWLMTWYYSQCDEDWEHSHTTFICNHNSCNWYFRAGIDSTALMDQPFEEVSIRRSETDWLRCSIKKETDHDAFEGYGGAFNLPEMIQVFRQWAQSIYDKYPIDPRHLKD